MRSLGLPRLGKAGRLGMTIVEKVIKTETEDLATRTDLVKWKDEILTSNDKKVTEKLDTVIVELAAKKSGDERVEKLD